MSDVVPDWLQALQRSIDKSETSWFTQFPTPEAGRPAAVLILFAEGRHGPGGAAEPDVLILQRAAAMRNHAGQPAFPGGVAEPGEDAPETALREANEEVGLDPASVTVLTELPTLWIPVSNYLVTGVLAWWHAPHPVRPRALAEVAGVARVPVPQLAEPKNRLRVRHPSGWIGPAFRASDMLIWGFTAGVLTVLLDLGGWAEPWDTTRIEVIADSAFDGPSVG